MVLSSLSKLILHINIPFHFPLICTILISPSLKQQKCHSRSTTSPMVDQKVPWARLEVEPMPLLACNHSSHIRSSSWEKDPRFLIQLGHTCNLIFPSFWVLNLETSYIYPCVTDDILMHAINSFRLYIFLSCMHFILY